MVRQDVIFSDVTLTVREQSWQYVFDGIIFDIGLVSSVHQLSVQWLHRVVHIKHSLLPKCVEFCNIYSLTMCPAIARRTSVRIEFHNGNVRFLCHCTHFLLVCLQTVVNYLSKSDKYYKERTSQIA